MESQEFESILGCIQSNGTRKPGAVDKFQTDTSSVIRSVAERAEGRGLYEDAVRLYDLAQVREGDECNNVTCMQNYLRMYMYHRSGFNCEYQNSKVLNACNHVH